MPVTRRMTLGDVLAHERRARFDVPDTPPPIWWAAFVCESPGVLSTIVRISQGWNGERGTRYPPYVALVLASGLVAGPEREADR